MKNREERPKLRWRQNFGWNYNLLKLEKMYMSDQVHMFKLKLRNTFFWLRLRFHPA